MVALTALMALAAEPETDLVRALERRGLVEQAYVEALRGAYALEDPDLQRRALLEAGALLHRTEAWELAGRHWSALGDDAEARLALAWTEVRLERPHLAVPVLSQLGTPEASYLQGWTHLNRQAPGEAVAAWQSVPPSAPLGPRAAEGAQALLEAPRLKHRTPGLAGGMSAVLPGLGQAYVGRWGEAGSSLLVNGAFAAGVVTFALQEEWAATALVGLFGLGFYGGNVLSAANGAKRFNRRAWRDRVDELRPVYAPELEVDGEGVELVVSDVPAGTPRDRGGRR